MHGRVDPNLGACNKLVSSCLSDPFPPPTDTTTLLVARYLLIKTFVARQLLTSSMLLHMNVLSVILLLENIIYGHKQMQPITLPLPHIHTHMLGDGYVLHFS